MEIDTPPHAVASEDEEGEGALGTFETFVFWAGIPIQVLQKNIN